MHLFLVKKYVTLDCTFSISKSFMLNHSVQSWSSEESRSIETGKSFLQGLEMDPESVVVDNSKGVYYKGEFGCQRYIQEVADMCKL